MTALSFGQHLTRTNSPQEIAAIETHEGMATWAGTGPAGKICRQCEYWGAGHKERPKNPANNSGCAKWVELLSKRAKPKAFPGSAKACRYFAPTGAGR